MTTTPDPKTVQQLATEHILDDARRAHDIGADVLGHFGPDALTKAEYHAYCDAVREAITTATVAVSWPDEQPQDGDVQAARAWLADLSENIRSYHQSIPGQPGCTCGRSLACGNDVPDYAAIWTLEAALDAWVPVEEDEQPQDEDGDVTERDGYAVRILDMLESDPDRFQESEEEDLRAALSALFRRTAEAANLATALAEQVARIAELERELRDLRGTELNPSPMVLDAQAYGELRDEIAATMGDEWDLDEAEVSILIKYVRWLAAGQPRDEDGYPIRRETYPAPAARDERDAETDSAAARVRATLDRHAARGSIGGEYLDDDVRAVLDNREMWRNLALSRGAKRDERDGADDGFAWHELHYGLGPDPLGPEPESRYYQLFHADQCLTLPTGAVCWADHEPHRHWWPAEDGEYRIRPVEMSGGGTEDGPNEPTLTMEIQVRAGEDWADYNGPCVGDLEARDAGDGR